MMRTPDTTRWIAVVALSAALAACVGDGSDDTESAGNSPIPSAPAPSPSAPAPAATPSGTFTNFQAPANWIGQPDATSDGAGTTASSFINARGMAAGADGKLYIADGGNDRLLVFAGTPSVNGVSAIFAVGAPDLNSAGSLDGAAGVSIANGKMAVATSFGRQVAIYNTVPQAMGGAPDVLLGQAGVSACAANRFGQPMQAVLSPNGKLLVSDRQNNRVLIWNSVPATSGQVPDLVLGQNGMDACAANDDAQDGTGGTPSARTFFGPNGVWTDGTRLAIADSFNNRVLLWNTFPTTSFQPADVVLGQEDFTTNEAGLSSARMNISTAVAFSGRYLAIADSVNHRVLLWDGWPTTSGRPADIVLGQPDFNDGAERTRDATTLTFPIAVTFVGSTLFVTESPTRVTIFKPAP